MPALLFPDHVRCILLSSDCAVVGRGVDETPNDNAMHSFTRNPWTAMRWIVWRGGCIDALVVQLNIHPYRDVEDLVVTLRRLYPNLRIILYMPNCRVRDGKRCIEPAHERFMQRFGLIGRLVAFSPEELFDALKQPIRVDRLPSHSTPLGPQA